jgi:integrase/recombinase XerD
MDLHTATNTYLKAQDNGLRTVQTLDSYQKTLWAFAVNRWSDDVRDVSTDELVEFITSGSVSDATMNNRKTRLVGMFKWLEAHDHIAKNPANRLELVLRIKSQTVRHHHWLTLAETRLVLQAPDSGTEKGLRDLVVLRLGFTCGLRRAEIADLTWGQVNFDRHELYVIGKGGKAATLFLTPDTQVAIAQLYSKNGHRVDSDPVVPNLASGWHTPIGVRTIANIVTRVSKQIGIPFRTHDMRRTFAGLLMDRGVPLEGISKALRHSDVGTTQRYLEQRQDAGYQVVKGAGLDL